MGPAFVVIEARPQVALASLQMLRYRILLSMVVVLAALTAVGCRKKIKTAKPPRIGDTETGIASWYGYPYHGRRAANGEVYDMEQLTAAHRTLPFETWVRVRNLSNDKTVDVRIQDRGPFVDKRIIDLSRAAAREIDMIRPGITKVKLTVIPPPAVKPKPAPVESRTKEPPLPPPPPITPTTPAERTEAIEQQEEAFEKQPEAFAVQVGAFRDRTRAESLRESMAAQYGHARLVERAAEPPIWRVLVGEEPDQVAAEELAVRIRAAGVSAFVVRLDQAQPNP